MGKRRRNAVHDRKQVPTKNVTPELKENAEARNVLINQPELTLKSSKKPLKGTKLKKFLMTTQLYGKKKQAKKYSEKELDIPVLNESINPGAIKKKGKKKGKKFVADGDSVLLTRLIKQINDGKDEVNESKLEKARRLEDVRELRRTEIERKESVKRQELENAKDELKSSASQARSERRRASRLKKRLSKNVGAESGSAKSKKPKKSVSFA
ncbi:hypothetical protein HII12_003160 [Brettanomyces bruxellensis]|uniref:60S ribosomal subunit assembly/export protein LOC1 n=1 Tax=Dekkera bruxellensis TaxID=5007 RepID=A0A7D9CX70_DEKBR|nr:uncharacterized protein BRETT_004146 [Brettanomyces bruxellensis]KAF6009614.1 hypothetical protein HII12_003160 [Brettanomyces bruxellensis]QOU18925.1 hypothetical protein BRETT_004146 [Brettanomyces bruxellensis]VUG17891.1 LOC1 [Brettanomyces bruxellensis]